jgi:hypothetical protein
VVGHGYGLLSELGYLVDEFLNVAGSVQQRVFRVQMQVREFVHSCIDSKRRTISMQGGLDEENKARI